ncbi:MAG: hypothetical protein KatS3mg111_4362 [Pirellulaceae bacterium]|nr:MAG: hypothetical protein KatS3mg111_4362 [Pirellulaceae bacterium]
MEFPGAALLVTVVFFFRLAIAACPCFPGVRWGCRGLLVVHTPPATETVDTLIFFRDSTVWPPFTITRPGVDVSEPAGLLRLACIRLFIRLSALATTEAPFTRRVGTATDRGHSIEWKMPSV